MAKKSEAEGVYKARDGCEIGRIITGDCDGLTPRCPGRHGPVFKIVVTHVVERFDYACSGQECLHNFAR